MTVTYFSPHRGCRHTCSSTLQDGPIRPHPLASDNKPELFQTTQNGHVGSGKGSVRHVKVLQMVSARTSILGRPPPLPKDRPADPNCTLNRQEVLKREASPSLTKVSGSHDLL